MLYDLMSKKLITSIPYEREYRDFMSRLSIDEINSMKSALNEKIEGTNIQTAGWMPGSVWAGTPYEPIYVKAARQSYNAAALCFGLLVWDVFMEHPEKWTSGRFEKDGKPIGSRTYFKID